MKALERAFGIWTLLCGAVPLLLVVWVLMLAKSDGAGDAMLIWIGLFLYIGTWLMGLLAKHFGRALWARAVIPALFGAMVITVWEAGVRAWEVPGVILPPPSAIWAAITGNVPMLWADFVQTVIRSVIPGYLIGCGVAVGVALAVDRSPFLQRGLLPIGNLAAALPIVGIAPIMVMWFGFDWQSKAAVVVVMVFFPVLVNTIEGLRAAGRLERELMQTYAASYWQTLLMVRLPAAAPHIFSALKLCTTLALIGAIVAEFFGTPITGIGFRISTEIGRLALDTVWAEIAVAAVAGSLLFGAVALAERLVTFWHPSMRG